MALRLVVLWLPALSNAAISLAAFSVAIVLAVKELLLCISGTWFRIVSRPFKVGDWVEINDIKGEVHDFRVYSTQLLEIGSDDNPYGFTGQLVTLPNSWLLNAVVKNQTFKKSYAVHMFDVSIEPSHAQAINLEEVQRYIDEVKSSYKKKTYGYLKDFRNRTGIELKLPNPQLQLKTTELGFIQYQSTLFCPSEEAMKLQNQITAFVLKSETTK